MLRSYEEEARGDNLVRLATEDEVVPNQWYYMKSPLNANHFMQTMFNPEVNWESILEFITTKKLYVKNSQSTSKPEVQQSSLF